MVERCAWCGMFLGVKVPLEDHGTTHGICVTCAGHMMDSVSECGTARRTDPRGDKSRPRQMAVPLSRGL